MSDEKREREAPRATARAKVCKPAVQEQAADSVSQKEVEAAPAAVPSRADQPLNDESRGESLVVTAGTAWPVLSNTEDAALARQVRRAWTPRRLRRQMRCKWSTRPRSMNSIVLLPPYRPSRPGQQSFLEKFKIDIEELILIRRVSDSRGIPESLAK